MSNNNNMSNNKKNKSYATTHCSNIECMICFDDISPICNYYFCKTCNNAVHKACYNNWWDAQPNKFKHCVHCQEKNTLILLKPYSKKKGYLFSFCHCLERTAPVFKNGTTHNTLATPKKQRPRKHGPVLWDACINAAGARPPSQVSWQQRSQAARAPKAAEARPRTSQVRPRAPRVPAPGQGGVSRPSRALLVANERHGSTIWFTSGGRKLGSKVDRTIL